MSENKNAIHTLKISTLGDFKIEWNQINLTEELSSKSGTLIVYLAAQFDKHHRREKIASEFWNSSDTKSARYNLRHTLWSIKKAIQGETMIHTDQTSLHMNPDIKLVFDANLLERCNEQKESMSTEEIVKILEIYHGEFLEDTFLNNAMQVNDWILYTREYLERIYFDLSEYLASRYRAEEKHQEAIERYQKLLEINPFHEATYIQILQAYLEAHNVHKAIQEYHRCRDILRSELHVEPCPELQRLYQSIRAPRQTSSAEKSGRQKTAVSEGPPARHVDLKSSIEYYGLQKIIATFVNNIDKSRIDPATWREIASLVHIYPPLIHEFTNIRVDPTEAAMLYSMLRLFEEYLTKGTKTIILENKGMTDPKSAMILEVVFTEHLFGTDSLIRIAEDS